MWVVSILETLFLDMSSVQEDENNERASNWNTVEQSAKAKILVHGSTYAAPSAIGKVWVFVESVGF